MLHEEANESLRMYLRKVRECPTAEMLQQPVFTTDAYKRIQKALNTH